MFLEEQQSGLSHLTDERRNLAEERSKLNMEQKLLREKMQQDAVRAAQVQLACVSTPTLQLSLGIFYYLFI